ncbi:MAG: hypothetical protein KGL91_04940 [Xanthomonadaceae bacterium]|nr:hypothetical protein [Xanthomonadaceae bacterium]
MRIRLLLPLLLLLAGAGHLHAQETVFYKCTDAQGKVSMQNGTPCTPGMQQEMRRIGEVKTLPVPTARPKPETSPAAPPQYGEFVQVGVPRAQHAPAAEAATLPAPPALFQCTSWKGETYLGETADPPPRCAPLQVVGIDGSAALGMGEACEMKQDSCEAIPEPQLCEAWYRRLDEADFKLRYADDQRRHELQRAFAAIAEQIRASRCATSVAKDPASP